MDEKTRAVQFDFDRLATISALDWNPNSYYDNFLLKYVPPHCENVLEIGCGLGDFSRQLARRSTWVLALDLSPNMIQQAKERSAQFSNIDFQIADVMIHDLPAAAFDCIVSIATIHHLPTQEIIAKMKNALRDNGTLIILDLWQSANWNDMLRSAVALFMSALLRLLKQGRLRSPREIRQAWDEHGQKDTYLTMPQVRRICAELLPRAQVRQHWLWRYSVVWRKVSS